ncbi:cytidylyltransferase domain-containing protein [Sulfurimonas sp.]|uniref:acylneuraminate cytidylyltransferase family protein n=1 Tax=Sulfurimonas sp. TaxID=2022749 RepID=UPI003D1222B6
MNIVALLTGRGNNTLVDKNILPVLGQPLISYPAKTAKKVKTINHFYVSSDDEKILNIANDLGYKKIKRPLELASPTAKHIDAILHAVEYMQEKDNIEADILIVFLANSATVKHEWIEQGIQSILDDSSISSVVPVYQEQDHHPFRAKKLNKDGSLETFFDFTDMEISTNRQELEPCYFLCHNFWILNMKNSLFCQNGQKPWKFLGDKIKPIVVDECFDVHTKEDLTRCEKWLQKNI